MTTGRRLLVRLLASGLLLAALLEVGAGVVWRARTGAWPDLDALDVTLAERAAARLGDGGLGDVPTPNARFLSAESLHPYVGFLPRFKPQRELEHGMALNEERFYGPDSPIFSDPDEAFVIAVIGGSVAGRFMREGGGDALVELLADAPWLGGRPIRFAVLAFGGHKQPQGLMALNYVFALGGRVDMLLALDGFNEVALHSGENELQGVAPSFPRSWFFRVGMQELVVPLRAQLAVLLRQRAELAEALQASAWRRSWTRRLLWQRADADLARQIAATDAGLRELIAVDHDLLLHGPASPAATPNERLAELTALWARCVRQLDALCRDRGVAFLQALQPNQYVPGSKPFTDEEREQALGRDHTYGRSVPGGYAHLRHAGAELAAEGIAFLDLSLIYADVTETIYVDNCCHVNELGNRLMAAPIAEALRGLR